MSVNDANYDHRGRNNQGIVIRCPNLFGPHLVYFDRDEVTGSWTVRDFISGGMLDNHHSEITVAEIEADADHDEFPPWVNVQADAEKWKTYLLLRTSAISRAHNLPTAKELPESWKPIS